MHIEVSTNCLKVVNGKRTLVLSKCIDKDCFLSVRNGNKKGTLTFHQVHVISDWLNDLVEEGLEEIDERNSLT